MRTSNVVSLITVVTMKKNRSMKMMSGKDAVEIPGVPPSFFFLNRAISLSSYIFRFGLGDGNRNRLLNGFNLGFIHEVLEFDTEFIH